MCPNSLVERSNPVIIFLVILLFGKCILYTFFANASCNSYHRQKVNPSNSFAKASHFTLHPKHNHRLQKDQREFTVTCHLLSTVFIHIHSTPHTTVPFQLDLIAAEANIIACDIILCYRMWFDQSIGWTATTDTNRCFRNYYVLIYSPIRTAA
jgi:hypothetical protein